LYATLDILVGLPSASSYTTYTKPDLKFFSPETETEQKMDESYATDML
jgi:hypothetical protein